MTVLPAATAVVQAGCNAREIRLKSGTQPLGGLRDVGRVKSARQNQKISRTASGALIIWTVEDRIDSGNGSDDHVDRIGFELELGGAAAKIDYKAPPGILQLVGKLRVVPEVEAFEWLQNGAEDALSVPDHPQIARDLLWAFAI